MPAWDKEAAHQAERSACHSQLVAWKPPRGSRNVLGLLRLPMPNCILLPALAEVLSTHSLSKAAP